MQITHQEARHLIQFRADRALNPNKKEMLNAHLKGCAECADYANEIQETEATLRTTLQKHWNVRYRPLEVNDIKVKIIPAAGLRDFLTTRSALVGITLLFFVFSLWQFTSTNNGSARSSMVVSISPIPTPSLLVTSTQNNFDNCQMIRYEVRQDDTVKGIAHRFSASENAIRELNNLQPEVAILPTKLIIPICELTPTGTTHPPTFTNTPSLELFTYTPG